ncbi:MAG: site-2 protease family protein [Phycisphaerales bacterium]|nr:MAG: site-2 protease family protein [Phycisphaerales bacterium]
MEYLSSLYNLFLIIFGFGVLIFVHELGHFLAAKWAGIRTEAFAVGMGPVCVAWRKGVGFAAGTTAGKVKEKTGKLPADLKEQELARHGIGETEYSLRWLPIGGFVKMLGQEDAKPSAVSDDPRSYNMCPVGRRMIVVSAGVIMNVLTALVMFIVAFQVGVRFEAPVVGEASAMLAAGTTMPDNATELGIASVGLLPGDEVTHINGVKARTFADVRIASAMSKENEPVLLTVRRAGYDRPLRFNLKPAIDPRTGLLGIGIDPGSSNTLLAKDDSEGSLQSLLETTGLAAAGVRPGMQLVEADGQPVSTFQQLEKIIAGRDGTPVQTFWRSVDENGEPTGGLVAAEVPVTPEYQIIRYPQLAADGKREFESGLLGMTPLITVGRMGRGGANRDLLREGDVILSVVLLHGPRILDLRTELKSYAGRPVPLTLLRDGEELKVMAEVNRKGELGIYPGYAWDLPYIAQPFGTIARPTPDGRSTERVAAPVAALELGPRTRIDAVNDTPVKDWVSLREALRLHTMDAASQSAGATVQLAVTHPTPGHPVEVLTMALTPEDVAGLHELAWRSDLPPAAFEPVYTTLSSQGNPVTAISMGFRETHKLIVLTYMTIDRLVRGTVGVEQLRGPVGIMHIGTKVADRGFTYLIFFLAMISVNLAVINFLPLPIVDGGLFLFLIYERFKGRPPSVAFQNVATVVGIFLIAGLFIVVTYNDIVRLFN